MTKRKLRDPDDQSQTYEELLEGLAHTPRVLEIFKRAHENRKRKVRQYCQGVRLRGLNELLGFLEEAHAKMRQHPSMAPVAFLVDRARADYETAIESTFAQMRGVAFDAMRDVMEIDYLLNDFANEPDHIREWLSMPPSKYPGKFSPNSLRQREAKRQGVATNQLGTSVDYRGHSLWLHVSPYSHPFGGGQGILYSYPGLIQEFWSDSCFWDMYRHGDSLIRTVRTLFEVNGERGNEEVFSDARIAEFRIALRQVQDFEFMYLSLITVLNQEQESDQGDNH